MCLYISIYIQVQLMMASAPTIRDTASRPPAALSYSSIFAGLYDQVNTEIWKKQLQYSFYRSHESIDYSCIQYLHRDCLCSLFPWDSHHTKYRFGTGTLLSHSPCKQPSLLQMVTIVCPKSDSVLTIPGHE